MQIHTHVISLLGHVGIPFEQNNNVSSSFSHAFLRPENDNLSSENSLASSKGGRIAQQPLSGDQVIGFSNSNQPKDQFDIWVEGKYSEYNSSSGAGQFTILHAGADYLLTPNLMVGIGAQFDWTTFDNPSSTGNAEGFGFMVGPYLTTLINDNLYFDGRAAWGQSQNSVSPYNTYRDKFTAERWLITAALIGEFDYGDVKISPELRLNWFSENTDTYVDSLNNTIPSYTIETGEFQFGPSFSKVIHLDENLTLEPSLSLNGIWTFANDNTAAQSVSGLHNSPGEGLRAKLEGQLNLTHNNGLNFSFSSSYDGIGDHDFNAWGIKGRFGFKW